MNGATTNKRHTGEFADQSEINRAQSDTTTTIRGRVKLDNSLATLIQCVELFFRNNSLSHNPCVGTVIYVEYLCLTAAKS